MVVNLSEYKSHPHKELTVHTQGVLDKSLDLTQNFDCKAMTKIAAIFHDLGKMNPNFQDKLKPNANVSGYANHAYLSTYGFFCFVNDNRSYLQEELGNNWQNKLVSIIAIIAKHHGNLPNFEKVLNADECDRLFTFINSKIDLPCSDFIRHFVPNIHNFLLSSNERVQIHFKEKIESLTPKNNLLATYLDTQFAFASLIQADKTDAGDLDLQQNKDRLDSFCVEYSPKLNSYLQTLQPNTELNETRTSMRVEATSNLKNLLKCTQNRIFTLTAPTGAGKTLMLLSLADEILQEKGNHRILYAIPFLSITEQVEKECLKIFGNEFIQRIDSKSENIEFQKLQEELENNPNKIKDILTSKFAEDVFLHPFVITTFVRFFETLVSNVNSTLLKLPSFSNCIFLIDEIQSLPPRLYTFFIAYLSEFCNRFNSYCIVSTATMPYVEITSEDAKRLFSNYAKPPELLSLDYFNRKVFNRYEIQQNKDSIEIEELANLILNENKSLLVILNTIDDSKDLYRILLEKLDKSEVILLNTHFTPNDRKYKIDYAKLRLQHNKKILLVSTQLIEAGVDIDFPVLYRDMAIIPSIIQSAGRCNRNGKLNLGKVLLFNLKNHDAIRSELIYRGKDRKLLTETKKIMLEKSYVENDLLNVQKSYFNFLGTNLTFGEHTQKSPEVSINFVRDINALAFDTIGRFRLIDKDFYGEEYRFYILSSEEDNSFKDLIRLDTEFRYLVGLPKTQKDFKKIMNVKYSIESLLKKMSNQIVQVRLKKNDIKPFHILEYGDLLAITSEYYSSETGISLEADNLFF